MSVYIGQHQKWGRAQLAQLRKSCCAFVLFPGPFPLRAWNPDFREHPDFGMEIGKSDEIKVKTFFFREHYKFWRKRDCSKK